MDEYDSILNTIECDDSESGSLFFYNPRSVESQLYIVNRVYAIVIYT
jgi:hypothetical protein